MHVSKLEAFNTCEISHVERVPPRPVPRQRNRYLKPAQLLFHPSPSILLITPGLPLLRLLLTPLALLPSLTNLTGSIFLILRCFHLQMGKSCNLELRLVPAGIEADAPSSDTSRSLQSIEESAESSQKLTIFYNGQICVCDVTEIQARAILCFANGEKEESVELWNRESLWPSSQEPQIHAPALSMKRSLQRFLQKRKTRIMTTSPYQHQ